MPPFPSAGQFSLLPLIIRSPLSFSKAESTAQITQLRHLTSRHPNVPAHLSLVRRRRHVTSASSPVNVDVGVGGVLLVRGLGLHLEGVGTKVIALRLEEVGREVLGAVAIEPRQGGAEARGGDTEEGGLGDDVSPAGLRGVDGLVEEVGEEEVLELRVRAVGVRDVLEEDGADDAAAAPHERDGRLVELPLVLLGGLLHEHEALRVRDDLGRVEGLLEVREELLLVALELGRAADELQLLGRAGALALDGGEAAGEDGLGDQGHGHAEVERVDGGPLAGSLLAGGVEDLLEEGLAVGLVVVVHDVAGDLDQEGVEDALVPGGENVTDLLVRHSKSTLHDIVGLQGLAFSVHFTI